MRLRQQLLTKNDCYKAGSTIKPRGVMVHSTGANNPKVCRYVPGDDEMGRNTGGNHWNQPGKLCVHAFVGKFADGEVGSVQTLPWNHLAWHCGSGKKGSANGTHIAFEICEDGLTNPAYFQAIYQEAVELTAMLCQAYGLDPLADGVVICHAEGHKRGIASNHGDVLHWWPKHGKKMDNFRADVARTMKGADEDMDQDKFNQMFAVAMEQYRKELAAQPVPDWAKQTGEWDKAYEDGIIAEKSGPQSLVTKVEMAAMIERAVG